MEVTLSGIRMRRGQRKLCGKGVGMTEVLTKEIANEYRDRAKLLPQNGLQDIGDRRKLRIELQKRFNLTELEAVNIINGFHIDIYVIIAERRAAERIRKEQEEGNEG